MRGEINFISDRRRYGWLSNFYPSLVRIQDNVFPTVEHAYQHYKTRNKKWRRKIIDSGTPKEAKRLGRLAPMREDWEEIKKRVMTKLVRKKFEQNPHLAKKLMETGEKHIREDAPWDSYWGTGKDGKGKNVMGHILMQIRKELVANR